MFVINKYITSNVCTLIAIFYILATEHIKCSRSKPFNYSYMLRSTTLKIVLWCHFTNFLLPLTSRHHKFPSHFFSMQFRALTLQIVNTKPPFLQHYYITSFQLYLYIVKYLNVFKTTREYILFTFDYTYITHALSFAQLHQIYLYMIKPTLRAGEKVRDI